MNAGSGLEAILVASRPQVLGALTRSLRDLDAAEEAFQEACLRALRTWPGQGTPRDPVAWLAFVGRNAGIDQARKVGRWVGFGEGEEGPIRGDALAGAEARDIESVWVRELDAKAYRDDVLRLLFICCHSELPPAHQIALALRVVAGLSVSEIARAFLVGPRAMEQRLTRAKKRIAAAEVPFSTPTLAERARRLDAVSTMIYLLFNEGYSASGGEAQLRVPLCEEAIRLARLLLRLFPEQPEVMGLLALCLLQHSRRDARLDEAGEIVLLPDQDRARWDHAAVAEGRAVLEKALRHRAPGPLQIQAAIAAVHAEASVAETTDWEEIDRLYQLLGRLAPSPVVTLNRAVAVWKTKGPGSALELVDSLGADLSGYLHFHGVRAAMLAELGRLDEARLDFEAALRQARTPAEASHLRQRILALGVKTETLV